MGKIVGMGIIGAGLWGEVHAGVYSSFPYAKLVAICDLNEERAKTIAKKYGALAYYTEYEELLKNPDINAVAVVTPDYTHRAPIVAAAMADKHIITEKPLATTQQDVEAIRVAVKSSGVRLMVDFHARWNPPIVVAKEDIENGKLGRIVSAYLRLNDTISVPTRMLSWASKSSILWFLGSHTVDILRFLFKDEVERVYSVSRSGILKKRGIDVEDIFQSILEFKSGIIATIENNWIVPNSNPSVNDFKVNILGEKGMISMDLTHSQLIERYLEDHSDHPDVLVKTKVMDKYVGFAYESIKDFVECVATGRPFVVGLEDGIRVTKVILAIMESARSGKPVDVVY